MPPTVRTRPSLFHSLPSWCAAVVCRQSRLLIHPLCDATREHFAFRISACVLLASRRPNTHGHTLSTRLHTRTHVHRGTHTTGEQMRAHTARLHTRTHARCATHSTRERAHTTNVLTRPNACPRFYCDCRRCRSLMWREQSRWRSRPR
jgi:hypothetical protein